MNRRQAKILAAIPAQGWLGTLEIRRSCTLWQRWLLEWDIERLIELGLVEQRYYTYYGQHSERITLRQLRRTPPRKGIATP